MSSVNPVSKESKTIAIGVQIRQTYLMRVGNTIIVGVGIQGVDETIAITVINAFDNIHDAVVVIVEIINIKNTIAISMALA